MGRTDYVTRGGERYDRQIVRLVEGWASETSEDTPLVINQTNAEAIWENAKDGNKITERERATMRYILEKYTFEPGAKEWLALMVDPPASGEGLYTEVKGAMLVRALWDEAARLTQDGSLDKTEAQGLWEMVAAAGAKDPACAHFTIHTVMEELRLSPNAHSFLEGKLKEVGFFVVPKMGAAMPAAEALAAAPAAAAKVDTMPAVAVYDNSATMVGSRSEVEVAMAKLEEELQLKSQECDAQVVQLAQAAADLRVSQTEAAATATALEEKTLECDDKTTQLAKAWAEATEAKELQMSMADSLTETRRTVTTLEVRIQTITTESTAATETSSKVIEGHLATIEEKAAESAALQTKLDVACKERDSMQQRVDKLVFEVQALAAKLADITDREKTYKEMEANYANLQAEVKALTYVNDSLTKAAEEAAPKLQGYNTLEEALSETKATLQSTQDERDLLTEHVAGMGAKSSALAADLNKQVCAHMAREKELTAALAAKEQELQEVNKLLTTVRMDAETLKTEASQMRLAVEDQDGKTAKWAEDVKVLKADLIELGNTHQKTLAELNVKTQEFYDKTAQLAKAWQEAADIKALHAVDEAALIVAKGERDAIAGENAQLQDEVQRLRRAETEWKEKKAQCALLEAREADLCKQLSDMQGSRDELKAEVEQQLSKLVTAAETQTQTSEALAKSQKEVERLKQHADKIDFDMIKTNEQLNELSGVKKQVVELKHQLELSSSQLENLDNLEAALSKAQADLQDQKEKAEKIAEELVKARADCQYAAEQVGLLEAEKRTLEEEMDAVVKEKDATSYELTAARTESDQRALELMEVRSELTMSSMKITTSISESTEKSSQLAKAWQEAADWKEKYLLKSAECDEVEARLAYIMGEDLTAKERECQERLEQLERAKKETEDLKARSERIAAAKYKYNGDANGHSIADNGASQSTWMSISRLSSWSVISKSENTTQRSTTPTITDRSEEGVQTTAVTANGHSATTESSTTSTWWIV